MSENMELRSLLEKTLPVVEEAAAFIRSQAGKVTDKEIESKSPNSLVSYVDKTAETILVEGLRPLLPNAGFITEEDMVSQSEAEYTWIIDPLDGTTNFLQQIPFYAVSVGLAHRGELVLGIVCDIEHHEMFYAWKGGGAWCNGKRIQVANRADILEAVVATGFPYAATDVLPWLMDMFEYFLKNAKGMRRLGSAALDLAYVACGRMDVYYESTLHAWDIAGGIVLVREAGGTVSDYEMKPNMLENGQVIAANNALHQAVALHIQRIFTS